MTSKNNPIVQNFIENVFLIANFRFFFSNFQLSSNFVVNFEIKKNCYCSFELT